MIGMVRGWQIDLQNFKPIDVNIEDIARSLSFTHRFNGHITHGYTVAEHCIVMARVLRNYKPHLRLEALLHDAGEAYTGDIITPIKELIPEIRVFSARIDGVVMQALFPECSYKFTILRDGGYTMSAGVRILDGSMANVESWYLRPELSHEPMTQKNSLFKSEILAETEKLQEEWRACIRDCPFQAEHDKALWLKYVYIDEYDKLVREVEAQ